MEAIQNKKPLVTFALFAYNQEDYIKEAVEAAFNQTYQPLEIIISDDGSSDKTFELILLMVQAYRGPHSVKALQTKANRGIMSHVLSVVNQSTGELIVMAAGDDISYPNRVEYLCDAWQESGSWGFTSKFDRINQFGKLDAVSCVAEMRAHTIREYFSDGSTMTLIHGATSAYDRRAFELLHHSCDGVMTEDGVMTFLLHCHNKSIYYLPISLVKYRSHALSLSNSIHKEEGYEHILANEMRSVRNADNFVNLNRLLLKIANELLIGGGNKKSPIVERAIKKQLNFYVICSKWIDYGFLRRVSFLMTSWRWRDMRWMLPRVFGIKVYIFIKLIILGIRGVD